MNKTLNCLKKGQKAIIKDIDIDLEIKERLLDMGITKGTPLKYLYKSPFNDPIAYLIKDTIIAIRKKDASKIMIGDISEAV